jgi:hypothetical protein
MQTKQQDMEVCLTIEDPIDLCSDIENKLLYIIKKKYIGCCYHSCLIKSITLKKYSELKIENYGTGSNATISVQFRAEGYIANYGDILTNVKVLKNDEKQILCNLNNELKLICDCGVSDKSIKKGQKIPIMITSSSYGIGKQNLNGTGIIIYGFKPVEKFILTEFPKINKTLLTTMEDEIKKLNDTNSNLKNKIHNHLLKLTNPIQGQTLEDIKKLKFPVEISRPDTLDLSQPVFMVNSPTTTITDNQTLTSNEIMILMIQNCIINIKFLREMIQIYDDETTYKQHLSYWTICDLKKEKN